MEAVVGEDKQYIYNQLALQRSVRVHVQDWVIVPTGRHLYNLYNNLLTKKAFWLLVTVVVSPKPSVNPGTTCMEERKCHTRLVALLSVVIL